MGLTTRERSHRINALLDRLGLGVEPPGLEQDAVLEHLARDKKHTLGTLQWILPTAAGVEIRSDVPAAAIEFGLIAALRFGGDHRTATPAALPDATAPEAGLP